MLHLAYRLIGERLSKLNHAWTECFKTAFGNYYTMIHHYDTNRLRNIAHFFGDLFFTDSISWVVFECVKINEDETTSSSCIFIKILMNEIGEDGVESTGRTVQGLRDQKPLQECNVPKNTRFVINYFTSIGLLQPEILGTGQVLAKLADTEAEECLICLDVMETPMIIPGCMHQQLSQVNELIEVVHRQKNPDISHSQASESEVTLQCNNFQTLTKLQALLRN
ncbi:hypothetical protein C0995_010165 [Termitomyces sp. Mi166|nr:hypothetical protein C0995_010165 [Termitomyces sp. Mi166\